MTTASSSAAGSPSPRVRLAELARQAALTTPGVVDLDSGPAGAFVTTGGGRRIGGVRCASAPEGGFDLSLRLVCELVPLRDVGDRARAAVETAAAEEQLVVQSVTVVIADITEAGRG